MSSRHGLSATRRWVQRLTRATAVLLTAAAAAVGWSVVWVHTVSANDFLPCHDNTTAPNHTGWTHGDPNTGIPGDPSGGSGYYYLSIKACGPIVEGTIYSPGDWDLDISPDLDHLNELAAVQFHGSAGRVFITNAVAGNNYRLRVANISTQIQKDYAELNSGSPGDGKGGCGGPGKEIDPNTGGPPVEPPPTPGLPDMGCGPSSAPAATSAPTPKPAPGTPAPPSPAPQVASGAGVAPQQKATPAPTPTSTPTPTAPPATATSGGAVAQLPSPTPAVGTAPPATLDVRPSSSSRTPTYAVVGVVATLVMLAAVAGIWFLRRPGSRPG